MDYDTRTFFSENEYDDVRGFTILSAQDDDYHIAEKWLKDGGEDRWLDYWIPASDLQARVDDGKCETAGTLTDDQFDAVCENVGWYTDDTEQAVPA